MDTTVAVLAPLYQTMDNREYPVVRMGGGGMRGSDRAKWFPFVKSVQHLSQTIKNCRVNAGGLFRDNRGNRFAPGLNGALAVYPKKITSASSPAKTSIIVTGQRSGAVLEFNVTITFRGAGITPSDDA